MNIPTQTLYYRLHYIHPLMMHRRLVNWQIYLRNWVTQFAVSEFTIITIIVCGVCSTAKKIKFVISPLFAGTNSNRTIRSINKTKKLRWCATVNRAILNNLIWGVDKSLYQKLLYSSDCLDLLSNHNNIIQKLSKFTF